MSSKLDNRKPHSESSQEPRRWPLWQSVVVMLLFLMLLSGILIMAFTDSPPSRKSSPYDWLPGLVLLLPSTVILVISFARHRWPPHQIEQWTRMRKKGLWHFVLIRGLLGFGGGVLALFILIGVLFGGLRQPQEPASIAYKVALLTVSSFVTGLCWGLVFWVLMNWSYKRHAKRLESEVND